MSSDEITTIHILMKATYDSRNDMLKAIENHLAGRPFKGIPQSFYLTCNAALKEMANIPLASLPYGTRFLARTDENDRLYELACFDPSSDEYVAVWICSNVIKGSHA